MLQSMLERNDLSRSATSRLLELISTEDADRGALVESFLYAAQTGGTTAELRHDVTFNELVSTGILNSISDPDLRARITAYYRLVDDFSVVAEAPDRGEMC